MNKAFPLMELAFYCGRQTIKIHLYYSGRRDYGNRVGNNWDRNW